MSTAKLTDDYFEKLRAIVWHYGIRRRDDPIEHADDVWLATEELIRHKKLPRHGVEYEYFIKGDPDAAEWVEAAYGIAANEKFLWEKYSHKPKPQLKRSPYAMSKRQKDAFFFSAEWRALRAEVLKEQGSQCAACGRTPKDNVRIEVDHINPVHAFPEQRLIKKNLQVLCEDCNKGKSARFSHDYRQ